MKYLTAIGIIAVLAGCDDHKIKELERKIEELERQKSEEGILTGNAGLLMRYASLCVIGGNSLAYEEGEKRGLEKAHDTYVDFKSWSKKTLDKLSSFFVGEMDGVL